ncbi:MAG TPA: helix-turn-helix transcriptional regulator [Xanthobacteraceae bacterium]
MATRNPMPVDVLVGQNIRICRLQKGLSQGELGQQIGVTFQQVQKYEKGANRVGASRLNQIANVLGVSLPSLFDGAPTATEDESGHSPRYLLSKPHSLRLLQGFEKIGNEGTRLALLQLVECLSQDAAHGGGGKPKGAHRK